MDNIATTFIISGNVACVANNRAARRPNPRGVILANVPAINVLMYDKHCTSGQGRGLGA